MSTFSSRALVLFSCADEVLVWVGIILAQGIPKVVFAQDSQMVEEREAEGGQTWACHDSRGVRRMREGQWWATGPCKSVLS